MNITKTNETAGASQDCVIKIDPKYKLEKVVSKDETRTNINIIKLDATTRFGQCAVATNGRSMAIVPVEVEQGSGPNDKGLLSVEALKASRNVKSKFHTGRMLLNGAITLPLNGETFERPSVTEHNYPNWEQVLPEKNAKFSVGLDAKLLLELAQALGSDGAVTLAFIDELSPITVRAGGYNADKRAMGVLMPMRVS